MNGFVQVDLEPIFFRLHVSFVRICTQAFAPRTRLLLQYLSFGFACFLLALLVNLHTKFVNQVCVILKLYPYVGLVDMSHQIGARIQYNTG